MAKTTLLLACPKCGSESPYDVWQSINASKEPHIRKVLLEGNINIFECPKCGTKSFIPTSLLYHDPDRQIIAQYYPPESLKEKNFFHQFDSEGRISLPLSKKQKENMPEYLNNIHITFSMQEFIFYIKFREALFFNKYQKN
ncbi:MAG: CpXC domain-containing protein [Candidatus Marinimicrobia bacterium]|nr:CpXC domain-containing protein [Candidatus Neomarinimicrobiota bacterium]MDD5582416.1 CpXC domain-containing protein [Candidatus Neomarinimicrobiota bacterium]